MQCTIKWKVITRKEWDNLLGQCPHATLLQSYYYAQAMRHAKQQSARHGIIYIDGIEAGIVQMQEVSLFGRAIHGLSIDRGPLWFKEYGKIEHLNAFANTLHDQFPARFGRKRRFMPEYSHKNSVLPLKNWIKNKKESQYKTFLVDINQNISDLRDNIDKKWRNTLKKSEKMDINIEIDDDLSSFGDLLKHYVQDRAQKKYAGASVKFIAALAKYAALDKNCIILNATHNNEIIASILVFIHGHGATYQIGWTSTKGREKGAHHLLLWNAILFLKKRNVTTFDLGGHNDTIKGVYHFKKGIGGQEIALIGSYY